MGAISADPSVHARTMKALRALGATTVVVMNVSGADPRGRCECTAARSFPGCGTEGPPSVMLRIALAPGRRRES